MSKPVTRREFLGTSGKTAAGVAAGVTLHTMLRDARAQAPANMFNIALIGCGGMGRYKLGNFVDSKQCNVVAVCDVDDRQMDGAAEDVSKKLGKTPRKVKDFRQVLDMKEIDIVIVATPDHWHATPMMLACQAGKDIYCEKPCCHNVREGRAMLDAATKHKRIVQVGTHQRQIPHIQEAREFIRSGKLGAISMTQTFTYGNESPDGLGHAPDEPVPPGVDYDTWLGPAPVLPFNKRRFHSSWRWYFDYASGMVGDWNVHLQDIIMWTMGALYPVSVSCVGGKYVLTDDRTTPDVMQAVYEFAPTEFAAKGFVQTYTMRKCSGKPWDAGGYGMDFNGSNGFIHLTRQEYRLEPDKKDWKDPKSEWRIPRMDPNPKRDDGADVAAHARHVQNFLDCVRGRTAPLASIDSHFYTVVACHLANVSLRVGRRIFWDHERELCFKDRELTIEDKEANQYLGREYRKGFELPSV